MITFNQAIGSLRDFAARLEAETGLRIEVNPDAAELRVAASARPASGNKIQPSSNGPLPPLPGGPGHLPAGESSPAATPVRIAYEGSVRGLLDTVARRFDLFWNEEGGGVVIRRLQSRTFRLSALAGATSGSSTISSKQSQASESGGGNSQGGSGKSTATGQTATISFENLSPWAAVESTVKSMLSEEGRLIVSPALGTLTVVDRRSAMEQVAEFVRSTNAAMSRQVALNVKVYSVTLSSGEAYGLDWDLMFKQFQGVGMTISNRAGMIGANATNLGLQVISPPGNTGASRHFAGSEVVLKALSSLGRVSEQISTTLVTLNNQPVPLQVGKQQTYLASVSVSQVPNAGSSTTLTPGQVTAGLDMSFVPHVLDDGRILLQYAMTLSDLNEITSIESNGSRIQLPNVNLRSFIQRVAINSGEMLVMSGFEQMNAKTQQQGVGDPRNVLFGGMQEGKSDRTAVVIVVQPTLL
jgi:type IVB pilus formation R64 PilN family outer membrane protein